jgi:hypothetical protein
MLTKVRPIAPGDEHFSGDEVTNVFNLFVDSSLLIAKAIKHST